MDSTKITQEITTQINKQITITSPKVEGRGQYLELLQYIIWNVWFPPQKLRPEKKPEGMTHIPEKKKKADISSCLWQWPDAGSNRKRVQSSHYNYVHSTKGSMTKEEKEGMMAVSLHIDNTNKKI